MSLAWKSLGHNQFESARWYKDGKEDFKYIRVEAISENEKRWNTVLQNIITVSDSTLIRTSYSYPYKVDQHLLYRDCWWVITAIKEIFMEVNPQRLSLVKPIPQYVLEIIQVDGYEC